MTDDGPAHGLDIADFALSVASPFVAAAGLVVDHISGTSVRGHLDLGSNHHTPWGIVHGGVYTSAIESAASIGASAAVADRGEYAVGVHNATDLIRASTSGCAALEAEPVHQGRTQQLWSVVIRDEQGRQLARGQVRLQNVKRDRFST
jgi:uncharacterized protein (TIGR00369 family)